MSHNSLGFFEFGPISAEVMRLRLEVEDMDDESLVQEAMDSPFPDEDIEAIVAMYMFLGAPLVEFERKKLIGYYILLHCIEEVDIDGGWL